MAKYRVTKRLDGKFNITGVLQSGRDVTAMKFAFGVAKQDVGAEGAKLAVALGQIRDGQKAARDDTDIPETVD